MKLPKINEGSAYKKSREIDQIVGKTTSRFDEDWQLQDIQHL